MAQPCVGDEQLAEFAAGLLTPEEMGSIEVHLASCCDCQRVLAMARTSLAPTTLPFGERMHDTAGAAMAEGTPVGRYVIGSLVGAGAMGSVYAAHDPELDRRVAIKVLRPGASGQVLASVTARMRREAQAMARLSHPNVVTVFDVGTFDGCVFVAMEFVEGMTLRAWLRAAPRTWREVLDVFLHAGRGLAAAHAAGLVHRDFKPDNVLVGADGRVRVTDFGLARAAHENVPDAEAPGPHAAEWPLHATLTRTGTLVGTPAYMSPEALGGNAVDARSDVFSFCVALHEGLYGQRPFDGRTLAELRLATSSGARRRPARAAGLPLGLRRALASGLEPTPALRHRSMNALLGALAVGSPWRSRYVAAIATVAILAVVVPVARWSSFFALARPVASLTSTTAGTQVAPPQSTAAYAAAAVASPGAATEPASADRAAASLQATAGPPPAVHPRAMARLAASTTAGEPSASAALRPAPFASTSEPSAPAALRFGTNHAPILP